MGSLIPLPAYGESFKCRPKYLRQQVSAPWWVCPNFHLTINHRQPNHQQHLLPFPMKSAACLPAYARALSTSGIRNNTLCITTKQTTNTTVITYITKCASPVRDAALCVLTTRTTCFGDCCYTVKLKKQRRRRRHETETNRNGQLPQSSRHRTFVTDATVVGEARTYVG